MHLSTRLLASIYRLFTGGHKSVVKNVYRDGGETSVHDFKRHIRYLTDVTKMTEVGCYIDQRQISVFLA